MPFQIALVHQFAHQQHETWELAFSPDGHQLVSSDGHAFYLWQLSPEGHWIFGQSFAIKKSAFPQFHPGGDLAALVYEEETVRLITLDGREKAALPKPPLLGKQESPPSPPWNVWSASLDWHWFLCNGQNRTLLLWDRLLNQSFSLPYPYSIDQVRGPLADPYLDWRQTHSFFSPTGRQVVFWEGASLHLCRFDPDGPHLEFQKTLPHGRIDLRFSPDGQFLAVIDCKNTIYGFLRQDIYLFQLETGRFLHTFSHPEGPGMSYCLLAFSPDSRHLMSCNANGKVDIFSLHSYELVAQFDPHPGLSSHATDPIGGVAWSNTGYLATGGASVFEKDMEKTDSTIKLWKIDEVPAG